MDDGSLWLQPLRIPEGWEVRYNQFYEIDPTEHTMNYFDSPTLLSLGHPGANLHLDMSWKPEYDPNGQFELYAYPMIEVFDEVTKRPHSETQWDQPLLEFYTKERKTLVQKIERYLVAFKPYEDTRILKSTGETDEPSETLRLRIIDEGLTKEIFDEVITTGNTIIQLMVIDHQDVMPYMLETMAAKARRKGHRKKASIRLNSKRFKKKHGLD